MDKADIEKYLERIYGYAIKKTYSRDEADELSQEIMYQALKTMENLRDERKFEPWLWGLADNVTKVFRRKRGRERANYSFDSLVTAQYEDDYVLEEQELYNDLQRKISALSGVYREIIILYYYDNLTCKEISNKLGISEGTVMWRLSEGRSKLKKECSKMTESALRPVSMGVGFDGNGNYNGKDRPYPSDFVNDALLQNIFWHCYRKARNIEELSKLCGVPAFFIEDAVNRLLKREALQKYGRDRVLTNMILYGDEVIEYDKKARKELLPEIAEIFIDTLKRFELEAMKIGFYTAGKSFDELIYLFGILALDHLSKDNNPIQYVPYQVRYDGNEWAYNAHLPVKEHLEGSGFNAEKNYNDEGVFAHFSYYFTGFEYRKMMTDDLIDICARIINHKELTDVLKEKAAVMIQKGYLKSESSRISIQIPFMNYEQKKQFDCLAEKCFKDILPEYSGFVKKYTDGYKKLFPAHLKDDVERACYYHFVSLITRIFIYGREKGLLATPPQGSICDILIQNK